MHVASGREIPTPIIVKVLPCESNACQSLFDACDKMNKVIRFFRFVSVPRNLILLALFLIGGAVAAPIILMTNALTPDETSSDVELLREEYSPDGRTVARHVVVSGGGAAGYLYHLVNVQRTSEEFDRSTGVAVKFQGGEVSELIWVNSSELGVSLEGDLTRVEAAKKVLAGSEIQISIRYGQ
jgi:hypothetical protein